MCGSIHGIFVFGVALAALPATALESDIVVSSAPNQVTSFFNSVAAARAEALHEELPAEGRVKVLVAELEDLVDVASKLKGLGLDEHSLIQLANQSCELVALADENQRQKEQRLLACGAKIRIKTLLKPSGPYEAIISQVRALDDSHIKEFSKLFPALSKAAQTSQTQTHAYAELLAKLVASFNAWNAAAEKLRVGAGKLKDEADQKKREEEEKEKEAAVKEKERQVGEKDKRSAEKELQDLIDQARKNKKQKDDAEKKREKDDADKKREKDDADKRQREKEKREKEQRDKEKREKDDADKRQREKEQREKEAKAKEDTSGECPDTVDIMKCKKVTGCRIEYYKVEKQAKGQSGPGRTIQKCQKKRDGEEDEHSEDDHHEDEHSEHHEENPTKPTHDDPQSSCPFDTAHKDDMGDAWDGLQAGAPSPHGGGRDTEVSHGPEWKRCLSCDEEEVQDKDWKEGDKKTNRKWKKKFMKKAGSKCGAKQCANIMDGSRQLCRLFDHFAWNSKNWNRGAQLKSFFDQSFCVPAAVECKPEAGSLLSTSEKSAASIDVCQQLREQTSADKSVDDVWTAMVACTQALASVRQGLHERIRNNRFTNSTA